MSKELRDKYQLINRQLFREGVHIADVSTDRKEVRYLFAFEKYNIQVKNFLKYYRDDAQPSVPPEVAARQAQRVSVGPVSMEPVDVKLSQMPDAPEREEEPAAEPEQPSEPVARTIEEQIADAYQAGFAAGAAGAQPMGPKPVVIDPWTDLINEYVAASGVIDPMSGVKTSEFVAWMYATHSAIADQLYAHSHTIHRS